MIVETNNLPCGLTLNFENPTFTSTSTVTTPVNQLPSYDTDAIAKENRRHFYFPSVHSLVDIKSNKVIVKRENSGDEGSMQFASNYTAATTALKPRSGAAKYFVQRSKEVTPIHLHPRIQK